MSKPAIKDKEYDAIIGYVESENPVVCPFCGCGDPVKVRILSYDFGIDAETGYADMGERFRCEECGGEGEYD